jgi:hypothetical protein
MVAERHPQLLRNREGNEKMVYRQQLGGLFVQPIGGLVDPASRAVPVAATAADPMFSATVIALIKHAAQLTGPATGDRTEHLAVTQRNGVAELIQVRTAMLPKTIGNSGHG